MKTNSFFAKGRALPFSLKPNAEVEQNTPFFRSTIRINSFGYRDVEFNREKAPGTFRVLCLGDSFTFGSGLELEQTYPKQLETLLRERLPGRMIEVINAGFASGDTADAAYLYLKNEGMALNPDFVFLGFLPRGDIDELMERDAARCQFDADGLPTRIRAKRFDEYFNPKQAQPHIQVPLRFRITRGLRDAMPWWDKFLTVLDTRFPILRKRASVGHDWLPGMSRVFQTGAYSPEMTRAWAYFEKLMVATRDLCAAQGARFTLMVIPSNFQCGASYWSELGRGVDAGVYEAARPQAVAREIAARHHIDFLDLLPSFRAHPDVRLFFPIDGHINADGSRVAADTMAARVMSFIPAEAAR